MENKLEKVIVLTAKDRTWHYKGITSGKDYVILSEENYFLIRIRDNFGDIVHFNKNDIEELFFKREYMLKHIGYTVPKDIKGWELKKGSVILWSDIFELNPEFYTKLGYHLPKEIVESWDKSYEQ